MIIRRFAIDKTLEKRILTGLIVSNKVIQAVINSYEPNAFSSTYAQKIASWIGDYYRIYKEAPNRHIQDIYHTERHKMSEEEQLLTEELLLICSREYEKEGVNEDYLKTQTIEFFKYHMLKDRVEKAQQLLDRGDTKEAESVFLGYRNTGVATCDWKNPIDDTNYLAELFLEEDRSYKFSGKLGEFIGPVKDGWLMGIVGAKKSTKSWLMLDIMTECLAQGKKCVFISLEMKHEEVSERFIKLLTGMGEQENYTDFPVFDCRKNQSNDCNKIQRANRAMFGTDYYRACEACRESPTEFKDFIPSVAQITTNKTPISFSKIVDKFDRIRKYGFGENKLRIASYPSFSANLRQVMRDLEVLEMAEGFVPQVIFIDYADILAPERSDIADGDNSDDITWKTLKQMAVLKNCLVVTATQGNRSSYDVSTIKSKHIGGLYRKFAHVDVMLGISRTPWEMDMGVIRLSEMAHRHKKYSEIRQLMLLQHLDTGQVRVDESWCISPE